MNCLTGQWSNKSKINKLLQRKLINPLSLLNFGIPIEKKDMLFYLLTFVCLFFTATAAASPIFSNGKTESFDNYHLPKFHQNLQSFSKRPMIANSERGNDYVLANAFATKDCNDGGQLFESMAILSGYCVVLDVNTAQRWTCDSCKSLEHSCILPLKH